MRGLSILACAALVGSASVAVAQQPAPAPQPSRPKVVDPGDGCTTPEPGRIECRRIIERGFDARMDSAMMKRGVLGVQLSSTGTARDTLGVFVSSVTPKGPAENAGIIEGDRIVSINGVDLRVAAADVEDGYASGLPAHRLQREVAKLTPGSRANLRVYSGGRVRDVQVTVGRASDLMRSRTMIGFGDGPGGFIFRDGMPPMARMSPMPGMDHMRMMEMMPGMDHMRMMEMMPGMEKLRESMPEMRKMMPELRRMRSMSPERLKIERDQKAKAKADSLKKAR